LTVAVAADRTDLEMTVTSSGDSAVHRTASGESYHALTLALENRGRDPLHLALSLRGPGLEARLRPDAVVLAPGEHRRLDLVVMARGVGYERPVAAELSAIASERPGLVVARSVSLAAREPAR